MSEGDSIHWLARRLTPALVGTTLEDVTAPSRRTRASGYEAWLRGTTVTRVHARGKHLLIDCDDGDVVIHSHMGMTGAWRLHDERPREWPRGPKGAWLVLGGLRGGRDLVQYAGPTLRVGPRRWVHGLPRLRALGPDICVEGFDAAEALARLRADDPTRGVADALLDQRILCGIGNLWKVEGCHLVGLDPFRPLGACADEELLGLLDALHVRMRVTAARGGQHEHKRIYGTAGRPCPDCGETIRVRRQGEAARPTWWCPGCQPSAAGA